MTRLCLLGLVLAAVAAHAAEDARPPMLRQVGIDQRLDAQVPLDLVFRDADGRTVRLGDYLGSRPVILNLAYYSCPMLCTHVMNGLVGALSALAFTVGEEYDVLTVSIDPSDTPAAAASRKAAVLARYQRAPAAAGWHFLVGEQDAITRLTEAVGYRYTYDAVHKQYAHAAGIVVLTPQGRVARYFFGVEFAPRDLRLGLVEASANRIGTIVDQILLYCYHYDPATGKYGALVMNSVRLGGIVTVVGLVSLIVFLRRRERAQPA